MKSIILVIKSNLVRRKSQNILLAISITLVALLLSCSVGILSNIGQPFDTVFNDSKASHILLLYDIRNEHTEDMRDWFKKQPEVERVGLSASYFQNDGPLFINGKKADVQIQFTEYTDDHVSQDKINILEGTHSAQPGYGEIWVPKYLAIRHHFSVGDSLTFAANGNSCRFKISALISDPLYGSGMVNPTRAWVMQGTAPFYAPLSQVTNNSLGIRLKNADMVTGLLSRFQKQFNYSGITLQYALFKSAFASTYQIIGLILFIFSLLALGVSAFIISSALSKSINDDYKITGILKSLGYTPAGTVKIYLLQNVALAILCMPIAFIGSFYIINMVLSSVNNTIGGINKTPDLTTVFLVSFTILLLIVFTASLLSSLKAGKVKPAEAIRFGSPVAKVKSGSSRYRIKRLVISLPFMLGLRFTIADIRQTIVSFTIITFTIFITLFSLNIITSLEALKSNKAAWGFENDDIQVIRNKSTVLVFTHEQLKEALHNKKEIISVSPFDYESATILSDNGQVQSNILGKVYEGDINKTGLSNINGRHPIADNEISLCIGTSRQLNKNVGDDVWLFIEGERVAFRVTGVYQDISTLGQGFRIQASAIKKLNPLFEPSFYSIVLQNTNQSEAFKAALLKEFGGTININFNIEDRIKQSGIIASMKAAFVVLSIFFIAILIITVWNDINLLIHDYRRPFGIFKALGLTPNQLKTSITWKIVLITVAGIIFGLGVGSYISPMLMNMLMANLGLIKFPLITEPISILLVMAGFFVLILVVTWLSSSRVLKISPRELMINN